MLAVSLGWAIHKARQQGIAVAALRELGCYSVDYDDQNKSPTILQKFRKLLGEEDRDVISVLARQSQINDAALAHLDGLTQLRCLIIDETTVTDAGLVHLEGLTQLQLLNLDGTHVTDAGLVHLRGLRKLDQLSLAGTQVTDAGLVHLDGLTQLRGLDLERTHVTDAGVQRLHDIHPNCAVHLDH